MSQVEGKAKTLLEKQGTILFYEVQVDYDDNQSDPNDKYATSIKISWGILEKENTDDTKSKPSFKVKEEKPGLDLSNLSYPSGGGIPNLNTIGEQEMAKAGIPERLARDILAIRKELGEFNDYEDLIQKLEAYYKNELENLNTSFTPKKVENFIANKKPRLFEVIKKDKKIKISI